MMECGKEYEQLQPLAASEYPTSFDDVSLVTSLHPSSIITPDSSWSGGGSSSHHPAAAAATATTTTLQSSIRHNFIHRHTLSTRTIAHYIRMEQIGEGTYGQVYRALCLPPTTATATTNSTDNTAMQSSGMVGSGSSSAASIITKNAIPTSNNYSYDETQPKMVALKKIRLHHPSHFGIPPTVLREIKILKALQHKNLVKMYEVVSSKGVEYLDWDDEREDEKRKLLKLEEAEDVVDADDQGGMLGVKGTAERDGCSPPPPPSKDDEMEYATTEKTALSATKTRNTSATANNRNKKQKQRRDPLSALEQLRESYKGNLFLVLEYISHDLTGLLDMAMKFTEVQVKCIARQLLEVLQFMHGRNYVHRDLKVRRIIIIRMRWKLFHIPIPRINLTALFNYAIDQ